MLIDVPTPHQTCAQAACDIRYQLFRRQPGLASTTISLKHKAVLFLGRRPRPCSCRIPLSWKEIWKVRFAKGLSGYAYRAFRDDWVGTPVAWDPLVALEMASNEVRVFVSWNGATEVDAWHVYVIGELKDTAEKQAFETLIHLAESNGGDCVIVTAGQEGVEVRSSSTQCFDEDLK